MFIDKSKEKVNEHFKYGINQWTGEPNKPVFYTKEMKNAVRQIKRPDSDLLLDIVMYPDFLALRLYEDNFIKYHGSKKEQIIDYVMKVKKLIESYGVRCELEGQPSNGQRILR